MDWASHAGERHSRFRWNRYFRSAYGVMLAFRARRGRTAPLLFTAFGNLFWNLRTDQPTRRCLCRFSGYAISPYDEWHRQAWAGALD